jgi:ribosomal protein L37AE/L43A
MAMTHSSPQPQPAAARPDNTLDLSQGASCPMCHTPTATTRREVQAGSAWRCVRCGQHWDATRLAAVAAYSVWKSERDLVSRRSTNDSESAPNRGSVALQAGRP